MFRASLPVLLLASASLVAQAEGTGQGAVVGSGIAKRETREATGFTGIDLSLPGRVDLGLGDRESVVVEADENVLPLIETTVEGKSLKIRFRSRTGPVRAKDIRILVTARRIESLSVAGSGDIRAAALSGESLAANLAGSGNIQIGNLEVGKLRVSISGSGDFNAGGKADSLSADIAGSGNLAVAKLATRRTTINIAGSGDAKVWAREALNVNVVGSGDVSYYGDPAVSKSVLGSGAIKRLGAAPG